MEYWKKFKTFKQRGEWVELQFMAAAALRGCHVLKPWGETLEYDVGIDHRGNLLRVQVKCSSARNGTGYICQFRRNYLVEEPYSLDELDLFAMYIIPENAWYLIPAVIILTPTLKQAVMLCPVTPRKQDRYKYEHYREAWSLLTKSARQLSRSARPR
jgi:PD-(D/E)XK endonuclease